MRVFLFTLTVVISLLQQCQTTATYNSCFNTCGSKNDRNEFEACVRDSNECDCVKCGVFKESNISQRYRVCKNVHCPVNNGRRFQNLEPWQDDFEKKYDDTLIEKIFKRLNDDQHYF